MIFVFWMLSFKPGFSLSSFIRRLFSFSLLSAIRVVSSAYLRLLVFLLAVLIPAWASSILAFRMMNSTYKLNKQGDNIQPWCTPFPVWNQSIVPCAVLTVASWPAYRFLRRQVRWSSIPICLIIFALCCDPHSQRLWHSQWSRGGCFFGALLLFLWSRGCWQFDLWSLWLGCIVFISYTLLGVGNHSMYLLSVFSPEVSPWLSLLCLHPQALPIRYAQYMLCHWSIYFFFFYKLLTADLTRFYRAVLCF